MAQLGHRSPTSTLWDKPVSHPTSIMGQLCRLFLMHKPNTLSLHHLMQQEVAAFAATQFAILVQSAQSSGLLVFSPAPAVAPQATPLQQATPPAGTRLSEK